MEKKQTLFRKITGIKTPSTIKKYLAKASNDLEEAVSLYYDENPALILKRKVPVNTHSKYTGSMRSVVLSSSRTKVLSSQQLIFRPTKLVVKKKKEKTDTTIRVALSQNSISMGKLPQRVSEFLHPLLVAGFIEIEGSVLESKDLDLLDSVEVSIGVYLKPSALSDPNSEDTESCFQQREAFVELFKALELPKVQSALRKEVQTFQEIQECTQLLEYQKHKCLEGLSNTEFPEMNPPNSFKTSLFRYQKQALAWMVDKETETFGQSHELHHLWDEYQLEDGSSLYFSPFTGRVSEVFPRAAALCKGGILADEMGLGKTVMMIALIHTQRGCQSLGPKAQKTEEAGTLIVVSLSLLTQWASELESHGSGLKVVEWHSAKTKTMKDLTKADVVLTTYGTLNSELSQNGCLFRANWYRVILDEAHTIKNSKTTCAKACFKLQAKNKWALTGTPVQNSLDDLYSLVKFLELEAWSNKHWWGKVITEPFNKGDPSVYSTLRRLLSPIMLRRTKNTTNKGLPIVELPQINYRTIQVEMSERERTLYDKLFNRSKATFQEILLEGKLKTSIASIFELILRLRQLCNHPFLITSKQNAIEEVDSIISKSCNNSSEYLQVVIDQVKQGMEFECPMCLENAEDPVITKCGHVLCRPCAHRQIQINRNCPICKTDLIYADLNSLPRESSLDLSEDWTSSSKLDALLDLLKQEEPTVVFTQWTSMLDIIQHALSLQEVPCLRLDGSLRKTKRQEVIQKFEREGGVFLVSLKAGGVGLNLTKASRVVIMDPWWNPAVEQQAIERVYRIGQLKEVTAVRLICSNTVEERMVELQKSKNQMIEGAYGYQSNMMNLENLKLIFKDLITE